MDGVESSDTDDEDDIDVPFLGVKNCFGLIGLHHWELQNWLHLCCEKKELREERADSFGSQIGDSELTMFRKDRRIGKHSSH